MAPLDFTLLPNHVFTQNTKSTTSLSSPFTYILSLSLSVSVVLYNCSVGREDCSLCKNADTKYKCVWCDTTHSCIYSSLCTKELEQCPAPTITDVRNAHKHCFISFFFLFPFSNHIVACLHVPFLLRFYIYIYTVDRTFTYTWSFSFHFNYFLQIACSECFLTHTFTPDHTTLRTHGGANLGYYKRIQSGD